eukprot:9502486-Pyramimonas_sp.AAC.1
MLPLATFLPGTNLRRLVVHSAAAPDTPTSPDSLQLTALITSDSVGTVFLARSAPNVKMFSKKAQA